MAREPCIMCQLSCDTCVMSDDSRRSRARGKRRGAGWTRGPWWRAGGGGTSLIGARPSTHDTRDQIAVPSDLLGRARGAAHRSSAIFLSAPMWPGRARRPPRMPSEAAWVAPIPDSSTIELFVLRARAPSQARAQGRVSEVSSGERIYLCRIVNETSRTC